MKLKQRILMMIIAASVFLLPRLSLARPGDLDRSFADRGIYTSNFGRNDSVQDLAMTPDGKIIAIGLNRTLDSDFGVSSFFATRLTSDGTLDHGFAGRGTASSSFTLTAGSHRYHIDSQAKAVAVQRAAGDDYKVLVTGYTQTLSSDATDSRPRGNLSFGLVRFNSDGTPDADFQPAAGDLRSDWRSFSSGWVVTDFDERQDYATDVAVDSEGRIVVSGLSCLFDEGSRTFRDCKMAVVRYDRNGGLDRSFGHEGKALLDLGNGLEGYKVSTLIQADDKILLLSSQIYGEGSETRYDYVLARLNTDGNLDAGFGEGGWGVVGSNFGRYYRRPDGSCLYDVSAPTTDLFYSLALQEGGSGGPKILIAGTTGLPFGVVRFDNNGRLDTSFGCGGKTTYDVGPMPYVDGLVVQPNGKIILTGHEGGDFVLLRTSRNGNLDAGFGDRGIARTDIGGAEDFGRASVLQNADELVMGGALSSGDCSGDADHCDFAIARYSVGTEALDIESPQGGAFEHFLQPPLPSLPQMKGMKTPGAGEGKGEWKKEWEGMPDPLLMPMKAESLVPEAANQGQGSAFGDAGPASPYGDAGTAAPVKIEK
jgi:uncharacterized delta-60 repeat protein